MRDYSAISKKAAATTKKKRGADFYSRAGKKGAAARKNPYYHFAYLKEHDPEKLKQYGKKYGNRSKITKDKEQ